MDESGGSLAGVWRELESLEHGLADLKAECDVRWPKLDGLLKREEELALRTKWLAEQRAARDAERRLVLTSGQKVFAALVSAPTVSAAIVSLLHHL